MLINKVYRFIRYFIQWSLCKIVLDFEFIGGNAKNNIKQPSTHSVKHKLSIHFSSDVKLIWSLLRRDMFCFVLPLFSSPSLSHSLPLAVYVFWKLDLNYMQCLVVKELNPQCFVPPQQCSVLNLSDLIEFRWIEIHIDILNQTKKDNSR